MAKDKAKKKDDEAKEASAEGEGAEGEGEGGKKKLPLKMLIIAGVGALVVLGGGGAGAFFLLAPKPDAAHGEKADDHGAPKKKEKKADKGGKGGHGGGGGEGEAAAGTVREGPDGVTFYTLPDMVVNIQSPDGRPTYLKLKLTFEVSDHAAIEALEPNAPRLQDMFQGFLRELRPEDLNGSQGNWQLRQEILRRVNLVVAPAKIDAVLIEEMLIQ